MQDFNGKVAVVTGGASGIGLALAKHALGEGMRVVIADIEGNALEQAQEELSGGPDKVLAMQIDVARAEEMERLAETAFKRFGAVHLLCNNAGVGGGASIVGSTLADWQWVLGVNLWGVIHGIRSFVPAMIKQGVPCHVVNTASISGLVAGPGMGLYKVSKHAVVSLSETLYCEMKVAGLPIGVSVLCPAHVRSRIMDSARNRPPELCNPPDGKPLNPKIQAALAQFREAIDQGMLAEELAERAFAAIRKQQLYVLSHPAFNGDIATRLENILAERNPSLPDR